MHPLAPSKPHTALARWALILAVIATAAGLWLASEVQRSAAEGAANEARAASALLTAMLDQETGARGYLLSGRESFLDPYVRGQRELRRAAAQSRPLSDHVDERALLREELAAARAWEDEMNVAIGRVRFAGPDTSRSAG